MPSETMKALVYQRYGGPEVLQLTEVPKPQPGPEEIRIRVLASTVNRTDGAYLKGVPYLARLVYGFPLPRAKTLGCEFSGVVEAIGSAVTRFRVGDRIFGYDDLRFGGHAEYVLKKETHPIGTVPEGWEMEMAAALLEGAHYALSGLKAVHIAPGQQVLVNGGTGGIGSAAVQLLRYFGATITAVCATPHLELMKQLGADQVIDYTVTDFTTQQGSFDLIFDAVGKSSFRKCKHLLTEKGIYVSTELGPNNENPFLALAHRFRSGKKVVFPVPSFSQEDVDFLQQLAISGHFQPVIDRIYPLTEFREAFGYVLSGQKTGNVILRP